MEVEAAAEAAAKRVGSVADTDDEGKVAVVDGAVIDGAVIDVACDAGDVDAAVAAQSPHTPQKVISAVLITNPLVLLGVRQGASPCTQSTSAMVPQTEQTTWW
jgi:hypothetical protein